MRRNAKTLQGRRRGRGKLSGWTGARLGVVFNTEGTEFTEIRYRRRGGIGGDHAEV